jgi:prepilin-type N-terminal cleavage/methylation domain-containing protein
MSPQLSRLSGFRRAQRAFTLIEMMIVVAIITILAAAAIVAYSRQVRSARLADMRAFMLEIAAKQELFESFNGEYLGTTGLCPTTLGGGGRKVPFNVGACSAEWALLGVNTPRETWFQYGFIRGIPGGADCSAPAGFPEACATVQPNTHWWVAYGQADQDGDGVFARFITSSTLDGQVVEIDETE